MTKNNGPLTTYTVRAKKYNILMSFAYDLSGDLRIFDISDGVLNSSQKKWLFCPERFPCTEKMMREKWMKFGKADFEITVGEPDLSFNTFWQMYNYKVKKVASEKAWNRLSKNDKMRAISGISRYNYYLWKKEIAKAHAATYINQRYWEDEY